MNLHGAAMSCCWATASLITFIKQVQSGDLNNLCINVMQQKKQEIAKQQNKHGDGGKVDWLHSSRTTKLSGDSATYRPGGDNNLATLIILSASKQMNLILDKHNQMTQVVLVIPQFRQTR